MELGDPRKVPAGKMGAKHSRGATVSAAGIKTYTKIKENGREGLYELYRESILCKDGAYDPMKFNRPVPLLDIRGILRRGRKVDRRVKRAPRWEGALYGQKVSGEMVTFRLLLGGKWRKHTEGKGQGEKERNPAPPESRLLERKGYAIHSPGLSRGKSQGRRREWALIKNSESCGGTVLRTTPIVTPAVTGLEKGRRGELSGHGGYAGEQSRFFTHWNGKNPPRVAGPLPFVR